MSRASAMAETRPANSSFSPNSLDVRLNGRREFVLQTRTRPAAEGSGQSKTPRSRPSPTTSARTAASLSKWAWRLDQKLPSHRGQQVVQVLGIMGNAVEPEEDPCDEQAPDLFFGRSRTSGDRPELLQEADGDAVDMGEDKLFFSGKMEIDRPFPDPDLPGQVLHGHLPVSEPGEKGIHPVQDQVPDIFPLSDLSHRDL